MGCTGTGKPRPFLWGIPFLPSHKIGTQLLLFVWMNEQMNERINEIIQTEHNRTLWYIIKTVTDFPHPCPEPLCNVTLLLLLSKMESISLPVEFVLPVLDSWKNVHRQTRSKQRQEKHSCNHACPFLLPLESLSPASCEAAWNSLLDEKPHTAQKHLHSSRQ